MLFNAKPFSINSNMKKLLLSFILITILQHAKAQWSGDAATNKAIVTTSNTTSKTGLVSINDGNNNMIIAWVDTRNTSTTTDIFIQKINKDGSLPWGAAEKVVCDAPNAQANISMISDGAGGAILAWGDKRANTGAVNDEQVYGQRVKADGTVGWAANGVNLSKSAVDPAIYRRNPILEKVSATEFAVVFAQLGTTTSADFFAQKNLIADGTPVWSSDTEVHGAQANIQTAPVALADGTGGVFIVWQDPRLATSNNDIYGQKINSAGVVQWGASGSLICSATANQLLPAIVSDNAGGIITTWSDLRTGSTDGNIYAQRINSTGTALWTANGVLICSAALSQSNPSIINSGVDFIIAWSDPRVSNSDRNIYAQKINSSGTAQWTSTAGAEGVAVVTAIGNQTVSGSEYVLLDNGSGTCLLTWTDPRISTSDYNIFAQKLNSDGSIAFATDGIFVSNATLNQRSPLAISDGSGGLIIAWQDSRTSSNGEIFASRLYSNGTLPVKYTSITASLNTNQTVNVNWKIASEVNTDKYFVQRAGEDGVFTTIGTVSAANLNQYQFTDVNPASGNNYYQIKAVDFDGTVSLSAIASIQLNSLKTFGFSVYPNPTKDLINISFGNLGSKSLLINIIDLKGSIKSSAKVTLNNTDNSISLNAANLTTGIYIIQITDEFGKNKGIQNFIKL